MKRYLIRVVKYIIQLTILLVIIYAIMHYLGQQTITPQEMLASRGLMLMAVVVFFALMYPFFGFARRTLTIDASQNTGTVDKVMHTGGFNRMNDDPNNMVYRAVTPTKRLLMMYEDTITITTENGVSVIEGMRKDVVKAYLRMDIYIQK